MRKTIGFYVVILVYLFYSDSRSRECKKQKFQHRLSYKVINRLGWHWVHGWDLLAWWTLHSYYLVYSYSRESYLCDSEKKIMVGLYSNIYKPIYFKLGMLTETTKSYILISVWITLTFIQVHSFMWKQKLLCPLSQKSRRGFGWNSVCCHNLLVCWSLCWIYFAQAVFKEEMSADVIW